MLIAKSTMAEFVEHLAEIDSKVADVEGRVSNLEKIIVSDAVTIADGMVGATIQREFNILNQDVLKLRENINAISIKTAKWEGGGGMIYLMVALIGGLIGWLMSHIGSFW
jgi:hypothetical protein